jgi:four helix bundle protein
LSSSITVCVSFVYDRAAANLAEGNGRFTAAERKHFFGIARGSAQECVPLLELARRRGLISSENYAAMKRRLEGNAKMSSGLISGVATRRT